MKYEARPAQELFVKVRGNPAIWRLVGYDDSVLRLESSRGARREAPKASCRVGEARHWYSARSLVTVAVWVLGGGESFMRGAR